MKSTILVAGMVTAATLMLVGSAMAERKSQPTRPGTSGPEWIISCYRGPFEAVAWDKPNAIFVDELVEYGYSPAQAMAIGRRICRDEYGVGDEDYLRSTLLRILSETPPDS